MPSLHQMLAEAHRQRNSPWKQPESSAGKAEPGDGINERGEHYFSTDMATIVKVILARTVETKHTRNNSQWCGEE